MIKTPAKKFPGTLFLIVGPSRVGKDSILRGVLRAPSLRLHKVVTATTRACRSNEIPGKTYEFLSEEEFRRRLRAREFLEWAPVRGFKFGTPREPLKTLMRRGRRAIQQIDVRGIDSLRRIPWLQIVTIFILPGDVADLRKRLLTQDFTPAQRRLRWRETVSELKRSAEYDFRVVNVRGKLQEAIHETKEIIRAVR